MELPNNSYERHNYTWYVRKISNSPRTGYLFFPANRYTISRQGSSRKTITISRPFYGNPEKIIHDAIDVLHNRIEGIISEEALTLEKQWEIFKLQQRIDVINHKDS